MTKLLSLFLLISACVHAQVTIKGTISGYSKNQVIDYFPPIGKYANTSKYSVTTKIKDDSTFNLRLDIHEQIFIKVRIATEPLYLLVKPGDIITINLKNTKNTSTFLKIAGPNAKADYWYNIYMYNPGSIFAPHDSLLNLINSKGATGAFAAITSFVNQQCFPLDSLYHLNKIDARSLKLYKRQIATSHFSIFINELNAMYEIIEDNSVRDKIIALKNDIFNFYQPLDPDNLKVMFGTHLFHFSNVKDFIKPIPPINAKDTVFGVYNQYLLLPPFFCEELLGGALITQKKLSANEFNFEKGYTVFKRKFPKSAYLSVLNKYIIQEKGRQYGKHPDVVIDSISNFTTLKGLIEGNKGQTIYIDLWATWCIPCRQEFPYYPALSDDFKKHAIKLVYISIDDPILKNNWQRVILSSNLKGVHYLANKELIKDIRNKIYKNEKVMIPRYILVNKLGEIVESDAPRPSQKADLLNLIETKF